LTSILQFLKNIFLIQFYFITENKCLFLLPKVNV